MFSSHIILGMNECTEWLQVQSTSRPALSRHTQRQTSLKILAKMQRKGGEPRQEGCRISLEHRSEEQRRSWSNPSLSGLIGKHITRSRCHLTTFNPYHDEYAVGINGHAREESLPRMAASMSVCHRKCGCVGGNHRHLSPCLVLSLMSSHRHVSPHTGLGSLF
jgi:hypothetical protein